jgi:hypothetical protein
MNKKKSIVSSDPFGVPYNTLPSDIAIFPLPEVMLLPHGRIPLNVFEDRYVTMVLDSLKQSRLIGMVQPLEPLSDLVPNETALFHIGCAGRITTFTECDDGRIMITLQGICRFRVDKELDVDGPYRRVKPDFSGFKDDLSFVSPDINRDSLFPVLKDYFELKGIDLSIADLNKIENRLLIPTLGMINPFDYREKQAILETCDVNDIAALMISLMEMDLKSPNQITTKH